MPKNGQRAQLVAVCQFSCYNRHNYGCFSFAHVQLHHRMLVVWRMNHSLGDFDL